MKKKVLLSSILTIALCLCLIAGSTFALFTDSTSFNIAVTSGDVEILANAEITSTYSAKGAATADDEFLVDENGHTYTHEPQPQGTFVNGGTASYADGVLTLDKVTPGDRVDVNINVENKSNVAFVYRYKITAQDDFLAYGMVVTIDGQSHEGLSSYTSEWYPVVNAGNTVAPKPFSIELPVYAGNVYQSEEGHPMTASYTVTVEAVQGNAVTDNEAQVSYFTVYQEPTVGDSMGTTYEGDLFEPGMTDFLVFQKSVLDGDAAITLKRTYKTVVLEDVAAAVDGHLITAEIDNTIILHNCDIKLDAGAKLIVTTGDVIVGQVMIHNVTVNGELLTQETAAQYLQGVNWYQVW